MICMKDLKKSVTQSRKKELNFILLQYWSLLQELSVFISHIKSTRIEEHYDRKSHIEETNANRSGSG